MGCLGPGTPGEMSLCCCCLVRARRVPDQDSWEKQGLAALLAALHSLSISLLSLLPRTPRIPMGTRSGTSPAQHPPLLSIPLDLPRKKPGSGHSKSTRGWALRPHTGLGFHPSAHFPRGLQPEKPGRVAHTRERPTQSLEQLPKLSLPTDRRGKSLVPFSRSPNAFSHSLSPLFPRAAIPPGPGRVLHRGSAPGAARTGREGVLQRRRCSQARRDPAGIACKAMGSQNQ